MYFLRYFLLAATLIFTLDRLFGVIIGKIYEGQRIGQTGGKLNTYLHFSTPPETLFVGNSLTLYQIVPSAFGNNAYNLAHAGMNIDFHTCLIKLLSSKRLLPKVLILNLDEFDFASTDSSDKGKPLDAIHLSYYYSEDTLIKKYINQIGWSEEYKFYSHLYRYNGKVFNIILNRLKGQPLSDKLYGYVPFPPLNRDSMNVINQKREVDSRSYLKPYFSIKARINRLKYVSEICKQNNVLFIAFQAPRFRKKKAMEIVAAKAILPVIKEEGITYINLGDSLPSSLNRANLWHDVDHLNSNGAPIFSKLLSDMIRERLENR